jgi:hypothetical protein
LLSVGAALLFTLASPPARLVAEDAGTHDLETYVYDNHLHPLENPGPLLADFPQFCQPVEELQRFEAAPLIEDKDANLSVRAWRYSYNARGIVEIPNRLVARHTALIVVHPWGIDDANGWHEAEPAGVALCCTPEKNRIYHQHLQTVVNPLLKRLRGHVGLVAYSLPGTEDSIRRQLYRSVREVTTPEARAAGQHRLQTALKQFTYRGSPVDAQLLLSGPPTAAEYFRAFPGIDSSAKYNGQGFWDLPIPVTTHLDVALDDVVIYDGEGYPLLRDFLQAQGIRHVLLCGYNTDMCVCKTTAGYENLAPDFNTFLIGDATIATFPANNTPKYATNAALSFAALRQFITQNSWVTLDSP